MVLVCSLGATSLRAATGAELYAEHCTKCHGEDGKGGTKMGEKVGLKSDLSDAKAQEKMKDEDIVKVIREGVKEKETGKKRMKAYDDLSEGDLKQLVSYVRSLKK